MANSLNLILYANTSFDNILASFLLTQDLKAQGLSVDNKAANERDLVSIISQELAKVKNLTQVDIQLVGYNNLSQDFDKQLNGIINAHQTLTVSFTLITRFKGYSSAFLATLTAPEPYTITLSHFVLEQLKTISNDNLYKLLDMAYSNYMFKTNMDNIALVNLGKELVYGYEYLFKDGVERYFSLEGIKELKMIVSMWYNGIKEEINFTLDKINKGLKIKEVILPNSDIKQAYNLIESNSHKAVIADKLIQSKVPLIVYELKHDKVHFTAYKCGSNWDMIDLLNLILSTKPYMQDEIANGSINCAKGTGNYAYYSKYIGYSNIIL